MKKKPSFFERLTGTVKIDVEDLDGDGNELSEGEGNEWLQNADTEGELAVDVHQTPTEVIVKTMVAGVRPDDLDISITRDMITIKGKRENEREVQDEDYYHKELYWGSFSRTIVLPCEVEPDEAEASERHGLLIIKIPKIDKGRQAKLKVRSY